MAGLRGSLASLRERPTEVALAIAWAFAAAWLMPPAAIVVVLPFLVVLPGWLLVARSVPALSPVGRLGAGVVVSVYLAAHLVNLVATVDGGLTRAVIFAAAGLLAALTLALARLELPFLAPPPQIGLARVATAWRESRTAWLAGLAAFAIVALVLGTSAWRSTSAGWTSGGWNWSDLLVHVAIGKSLMYGNFPPEVPYYAGVVLSYHWFADLHGAILAIATGVDLIAVFVASSAVMAGVLALVGWELAWQITRDRRTASIAAFLLVFSGGMGWIRLPLDLLNGVGDLPTLLASQPYDNTWASDWPFFRIASVLGTGLLPHRATTFGLPGLVSVALLAHASLGRSAAGMLLAGIVAALLAPFHFYALPAGYLVVALLVAARREWRHRTWRRDALLFLAPVVLAIPFVVGPILLQEGQGGMRPTIGWGEARFGDGPAAVAFFYATNLGIPFALALGALTRRWVRERAFLGAWIVALFLVPNVVVLSSVEFDMNKYFQIMWVAVAIAAATLVRRWRTPLVVGILALSALSPGLIAVWHVAGEQLALTTAQERAAQWIEANTPPGAIFITDAWINSPVDLAGRLRVTSFGPYVANLGYDPDARAADVQRVRCDGPEVAAQVMRTYGAGYVLSSGGLVDCGGGTPSDLSASPLFDAVYDQDGVTVWQFRGAS
jgi:hypothetical protein